MSIEWITYKNNKILHIKYAGLSTEAMKEQIITATQTIVDSNTHDNLVITDMRDCYVDESFIELAKKQGKISLPYCKKSAILGISGIKKILLKGVNAISPKPRVPFETLEEAQEYLIQE